MTIALHRTQTEILDALDFTPPCRFRDTGLVTFAQCRKDADLVAAPAKPVCIHVTESFFCCWTCWATIQNIHAHCPWCGCLGVISEILKVVEVLHS